MTSQDHSGRGRVPLAVWTTGVWQCRHTAGPQDEPSREEPAARPAACDQCEYAFATALPAPLVASATSLEPCQQNRAALVDISIP
jgi:hypothetical protein